MEIVWAAAIGGLAALLGTSVGFLGGWLERTPEPSTALLLAAGLAAMGVGRRRSVLPTRPPQVTEERTIRAASTRPIAYNPGRDRPKAPAGPRCPEDGAPARVAPAHPGRGPEAQGAGGGRSPAGRQLRRLPSSPRICERSGAQLPGHRRNLATSAPPTTWPSPSRSPTDGSWRSEHGESCGRCQATWQS